MKSSFLVALFLFSVVYASETGPAFKVVVPAYSHIKCSSVYGNERVGTGHNRGQLDSPQGWSAQHNRKGEWMQFDLGSEKPIVGVVTQCRNGGQCVTAIKVKTCSNKCDDQSNWQYVDGGKTYQSQDTSAWQNPTSKKRDINFAKLVSARYVRLVVQGWIHHASMRAGVLVATDQTGFAQHLAAQHQAGADEVGKGYHKKAGTFKGALPNKCTFCIGAKCRRHCIQSHLHVQKAGEMSTLKKSLANQLKQVSAQKDSLTIRLRDATRDFTYHTRKGAEWMTAARHQHDLDVAVRDLKKANYDLKAAQKDFKGAKSAKEAALARRTISKDKKVIAQKELDRATASAKLTKKDLDDTEADIKDLERKTRTAKAKAGKLRTALKKFRSEVATFTSQRDHHAANEKTHEASRKKHEDAQNEASQRVSKHSQAGGKAKTNHDHLVKRAEKSHKTAKGAFVDVSDEDPYTTDNEDQDTFLETEEEIGDFF